MAKKIVRGITDVKTITNQDFDTNNVNDLLSDGQYNYIHRKKGKNEEYHNLTDNIKTISSDNTDLLTVTNNNKTTNTATLHPKHDAQKEQVLESTRNTITINHGENGTAEKTTVDTNPQKVLEHNNLLTGYGIRKETNSNQTTITMDTASVNDGFDLNNLNSGLVRASYFTNAPYDSIPFYVIALGTVSGSVVQIAFKRIDSDLEVNQIFLRTKMVGKSWSSWKQYGIDTDSLNTMLAQKQDVLTAGTGITIQGNTISATAPLEGATLSIKDFTSPGGEFHAYKHVVTIGQKTLTTFSFECFTETAEHVLTGELKEELAKFIGPGYSVSNGALSILHEVDVLKLLNSTPEYHNNQHATFTFYKYNGGGGGGGTSS